MISEDTKNQKVASRPVFWFGNLPCSIRSDEEVDSRLAGFPANLLYSQIADPEMDTKTAKFLLTVCFRSSEAARRQAFVRKSSREKHRLVKHPSILTLVHNWSTACLLQPVPVLR